MKRPSPRPMPMQSACTALLVCAMLLFCGITALGVEESPEDTAQQTPPTAATSHQMPHAEDTATELYPADVQTIISDDSRQIIKTYMLSAGQSPADIPRESMTRDGWRYTLTDITERRITNLDIRSHTETVEINTDTKELNDIIRILSPTLEHETSDGYFGVLALDISSVNCEVAGYRSSSYTATATREYPHLSSADTSLIPKTITDNGRTLTLIDVSWETQHSVNVDYEDIPESYRAVAKYTATVPISVTTGYVTTANYTGEIEKCEDGGAVYTAYFDGVEINPAPPPAPTPTPTPEPPATPDPEEAPEETMEPEPPMKEKSAVPLIIPILIGAALLAAIGGAAAYIHIHHNVKIYRDDFSILVAKDKISAKSLSINLTPLDDKSSGICFGIEIDRLTAKRLSGRTLEIILGPAKLQHKLAYEGNKYRIATDFGAGAIKAIY